MTGDSACASPVTERTAIGKVRVFCPFATASNARAPDDGLHDLAWDDFDGYHEAMLGHDLYHTRRR